jgi:ubiquinone/menaquinone biosynthesis C-methylase UbiE
MRRVGWQATLRYVHVVVISLPGRLHAKFTDPLLSLLDPKPGQKIVDLGCGSGELTGKLVKAVGNDGFVLGIDSSEDMVCLLSHKPNL